MSLFQGSCQLFCDNFTSIFFKPCDPQLLWTLKLKREDRALPVATCLWVGVSYLVAEGHGTVQYHCSKCSTSFVGSIPMPHTPFMLVHLVPSSQKINQRPFSKTRSWGWESCLQKINMTSHMKLPLPTRNFPKSRCLETCGFLDSDRLIDRWETPVLSQLITIFRLYSLHHCVASSLTSGSEIHLKLTAGNALIDDLVWVYNFFSANLLGPFRSTDTTPRSPRSPGGQSPCEASSNSSLELWDPCRAWIFQTLSWCENTSIWITLPGLLQRCLVPSCETFEFQEEVQISCNILWP